MNFNYYLPTNLIFGKGRINELGVLASPYGKKALVVTGQNSTKKSGLLALSIQLLNEHGIETLVFDEVTQNPLTTTATKGAAIAKENNCDMIVGLGGGSIMDCAKAIALLAINTGSVDDFIFGHLTATSALPIILVPTTCGTGSEANGYAVLTNAETMDKKSLKQHFLIPKVSIVDPNLMKTMPKQVFANVAFDALCHLMEASTSNMANPLSKSIALEGVKLVMRNIIPIYEGDLSDERYEEMTLASTIGGMVIYSSGVTLGHAMEHPVSGLKDIAHGKGLAILTPAIMKKTIEKIPDKFTDLAVAMGGKKATDCLDILDNLLTKLHLKISLTDCNISEDDIDWLVSNCYKVSSITINNHPYTFSKEEIKEIFTLSL